VSEAVGFSQFLAQADAISITVAVVLAVLSLASWSVILARVAAQYRHRRSFGGAVGAFWAARNLDTAVSAIQEADHSGHFSALAETAAQAIRSQSMSGGDGLADGMTISEILTRALRSEMLRVQAKVEGGLTLLASVGSTAPFIGLFGTVWGIYHALTGLSGASRVVLDKVAGPVGEALIMTAAGLFVAIPAVLAYNAFNRANRLLLVHLDSFAHDLHAFLAGGNRPQGGR
jgi:biopolymer transport protein ExbB